MNQKSLTKLQLFLSGLSARFEEGKDLFKGVSLVFTSGSKDFSGDIRLAGDDCTYRFAGRSKTAPFAELLKEVQKDAKAYDKLYLRYEERGELMEIHADDKDIKVKNKALDGPLGGGETVRSSLKRNYLINPEKAQDLLKVLDIMSPEGKIKNDKIRKYSQIDHYVEILLPELKALKDLNRTVHVVDCGCGKSYLSFVLNYYMTEVLKMRTHITGIDIAPGVIKASEDMAKRLGYRNMTFLTKDIRYFTTQVKPDLVLSLHACDNATDLALNFGIRNNAKVMVAVPCCHGEMNRHYDYKPFAGILKHGILKRRMADVLTDGLRCLLLEQEGYDPTIMEYISPLETPKNLLIKAHYTGRKNKAAESQILQLITKLDYAPALYRYLNNLDDGEPVGEHQ